jgi:hypothetical protein
MSWVETESPNFTARHEERDADDVVELLGLLEGTRGAHGGGLPIHPRAGRRRDPRLERGAGARAALHPDRAPAHGAGGAPLPRRLVRPRHGARARPADPARACIERPGLRGDGAARAGRATTRSSWWAQQPAAPSPVPLRRFIRYLRWAWLPNGAAQWFSGQTAYARPAIARRLREGPEPSFPPSLRDSILLGGTVFDLIAREEGEEEAVKVACRLPPGGPKRALVYAFKGRPLVHTEGTWRAHLSRIAGQA